MDVQPALPFLLLADSLPGRPQLSLGLEVVVGCTCSSACPHSSANLAPSWPVRTLHPLRGMSGPHRDTLRCPDGHPLRGAWHSVVCSVAAWESSWGCAHVLSQERNVRE